MRPRRRHHGPQSARWRILRGLHGRVLRFLFVALALGGVGGFALHSVLGGATSAYVLLLVVATFAVWPLAWVATFRIARPVAELANVATRLGGGELSRRAELPGGEDEVGEVAGALRGMADRVERQLQDQRALMAAVSHELRSPLARVRVLVELAREGTGQGSVHDDLQAEVDGMDALVGDLLAASRIAFEAISLRPLDALDVGRRALEIASLPATLLDGEPVTVQADATLLARAVSGLLDNAVRYGGGPVALRIRRDADEVRFEVEDAGPGFADGEEEQAFQPFWRRPGSPPGTGLGLALVRQVAEAHQGRAGAENRAEGGGRVWLSVPARPG